MLNDYCLLQSTWWQEWMVGWKEAVGDIAPQITLRRGKRGLLQWHHLWEVVRRKTTHSMLLEPIGLINQCSGKLLLLHVIIINSLKSTRLPSGFKLTHVAVSVLFGLSVLNLAGRIFGLTMTARATAAIGTGCCGLTCLCRENFVAFNGSNCNCLRGLGHAEATTRYVAKQNCQ